MPPADPGPSAPRRILIVEDEYLVADYLALLLEDLGYEPVGPVPTVPEALAAVAREKLDAALLDANLAGKTSAPIAAALAARGIPFIVVTGYGNLNLGHPALQQAPRVNKPFTAADLAAMLAKILA